MLHFHKMLIAIRGEKLTFDIFAHGLEKSSLDVEMFALKTFCEICNVLSNLSRYKTIFKIKSTIYC